MFPSAVRLESVFAHTSAYISVSALFSLLIPGRFSGTAMHAATCSLKVAWTVGSTLSTTSGSICVMRVIFCNMLGGTCGMTITSNAEREGPGPPSTTPSVRGVILCLVLL